MRKKKKKELFGDFYYTVFKNDQEIKTVYEWAVGEKEEYIRVCESVDGWGGIPLDVPWAKATQPYKDALAKINLPKNLELSQT
jgi:hypothetical protein